MSPRDRRALQVGFALTITAVVCLRVVPAAWRWERALAGRVAAKSEARGRASQELATLDSLERSAPIVEAAYRSLAPRLLGGKTPTEVAAEFSALARAVAEGQGARVERALGGIDSVAAGPLAPAALALELVTDTPGLFEVLRAIEKQPVVLTVQAVRISSVDPLASGAAPESLRVALDLSGWAWLSETH